jgi:redox-sensitive bicupin YhaK (pirin superfamily)
MKPQIQRRNFLTKLTAGIATAIATPLLSFSKKLDAIDSNQPTNQFLLAMKPMGFQWETQDPFLFCVHHEDYFPKGNLSCGPQDSLAGRHLGDDFILKDGYRMYHGKTVPGFPGHPHRGFETITVVRKGLVDHADSMGAAGRYGNGDVQWMTAGKGVQHSEMFPLLNQNKNNPLELFQIWLNLPAKDKMVQPHFKMFWSEDIPKIEMIGKAGSKVLIEVIIGKFNKVKSLQAPPDSWAANPMNEVAVWNVLMEPNSILELPLCSKGINRNLYVYEGDHLSINELPIKAYHSVTVDGSQKMRLNSGETSTQILILQGRPINEHVIQYGPFVMNTKEEIHQAFEDYHATQFGGWPWPKYDQVHARSAGRFAKHADGKIEKRV